MREKSPLSPVGEEDAVLRADNEGFTLLEVLVALTILSISLVVLMGIFSQDLSRARDMRDGSAARALAQSLIAQRGDPGALAMGDSEGRDGAFVWHVHTAQAGTGEPGAPQMALITASVRWGGGEHAVSLTTLRAMPKPSSP